MIRIFRDEISDPGRFVVTLELVPGTESRGRSVDTVMQMAADANADGRISAVSITDNPGGNPSLSPDVLRRGYGEVCWPTGTFFQIFKLNLFPDIIHGVRARHGVA